MSHQVSVARRLDDSPQISDAFHQTPHTSDSQAGQVSLASSVQLSTGVTCLVSELGWVVQFLRLLEQTCSTGVLLPHLYPASYITEHPFLRPSSESKVGVEVALSPGGAVTSRLLLGGGNTDPSCLSHGVMPSYRRDKCDSTGSGMGVRNFCVMNF